MNDFFNFSDCIFNTYLEKSKTSNNNFITICYKDLNDLILWPIQIAKDLIFIFKKDHCSLDNKEYKNLINKWCINKKNIFNFNSAMSSYYHMFGWYNNDNKFNYWKMSKDMYGIPYKINSSDWYPEDCIILNKTYIKYNKIFGLKLLFISTNINHLYFLIYNVSVLLWNLKITTVHEWIKKNKT